ncbi:tRNA pseudouridine(55) synthase TruB [Fulvivirga lutea]|uniref:tRNA pseudouridine synthase B n=1 Tax=Fulvivirga lutea TaxID=2810512 RepID=A0A974WEU7_9BACT|nr:tRNA pseudouridine(55) synthase TruB [Fulvivirga lutea]QSE96856.1 tRNA pseudouridine(55) synthase TruB [Fulvivirga lutea]
MDPNAAPQDPGEVLLVDKPLEWTSFDVVKKLRYHLKVKKIGHAGTLDPLATGLLILCTGKKTKQIESFQAQEKEYTGTFTIGSTTPSYDLETEIENTQPINHITREDLINAATKLTGIIDQVPPTFSAIKVDGKRAYKGARAGEKVELKSRKVEIKDFEIVNSNEQVIEFRIVCSKGTYIRSIARDFGELLGVGAYLSSLRRTRIGDYHVSDAKTIEELTSK